VANSIRRCYENLCVWWGWKRNFNAFYFNLSPPLARHVTNSCTKNGGVKSPRHGTSSHKPPKAQLVDKNECLYPARSPLQTTTICAKMANKQKSCGHLSDCHQKFVPTVNNCVRSDICTSWYRVVYCWRSNVSMSERLHLSKGES
jgi:hypothetical protein